MPAPDVGASSPVPDGAPVLDGAASIYRDNARAFVSQRQNDAEANMRAQLAALVAEDAAALPPAPVTVTGGFQIEGLGETPVLSLAAQEDEAIKAAVLAVQKGSQDDSPPDPVPSDPTPEG